MVWYGVTCTQLNTTMVSNSNKQIGVTLVAGGWWLGLVAVTAGGGDGWWLMAGTRG